MSVPCQAGMPVAPPELPTVQPDLVSNAAGDAQGCCRQPAGPAGPDKLDGLDLAEVITSIPLAGSNVPASSPATSVHPKNLDRGWAWLIMIAALFTHILTFGMSYATLGAFHVELLREFGGTNAETSWTGSIMLGMMLCSGPMISVFIDKFGACAVAVVGGALASAGFILSATATSLIHLYFSFGVLAGLGFGMSYLPCIVMLGNFFERRRAFAAGISASGSGLGTFIFAPVNQSLLANLGWRNSFIVLGVLELMLCLCGATYLARKIPVRVSGAEGDRDINVDNSATDGDGMAQEHTEQTVAILSRPETGASAQSLNSPVGSWKQSIGVKVGRSVLLQSPRNSPVPASPYLLDSFFGLPSPSAANNVRGRSLANNSSSVGESGSRISPAGPLPAIEIVHASSPPSPVHSPTAYSPNPGGFTIGSWQQSVNVRAGVSSFLQSPITSPTAGSPLATDNSFRDNNSRLSVPSALEASQDPSAPGSLNQLPTTTLLECLPEEERLYPVLGDLTDNASGVSVTSIEAGLRDDLEEGSSQKDTDNEDASNVTPTRNCQECLSTLTTIGGLFRNRFFVFFWFSGFILCIGYQLPYMYFKAFALSRGLEQDAWAVILAVMGITDTVGRLVVGFIFDRVMCVSHRLMGYVASLFISCFLLALMSTASTYSTLALTAATYTLVAGSTDPLVPALLVEYVGLESLGYSFGLVIEMQGLGFLVGPPLAGFVYAHIQDYSAVYVVGAIAFLGSGVVLLLEPILGRVQTWRERSRHNNSVESPVSVEMAQLAA
ncbi:uncharacterized protein LOC110986399 [Acanthaster planci]|uniref:Uncharacterized protein LOC110986399 n=1 Tax=Acanthaster planci TaxID=133434 RepID=A0A8B7ZE46_ACAPL|nr:uncharacterized protein LOC110986399 [Acanthaster planci]